MIYNRSNIHRMTWAVEFTNEFEQWWADLDEGEQDAVDRTVRLLQSSGPALPFPYSSGVRGTKRHCIRELRIQHQGNPYRVLYAFDPRRVAILLLGGDKCGDDRWYDVNVPIAECIYQDHLAELQKEGLDNG